MKPLHFCLDYLLNHLYQNRLKPEGKRVAFDPDHVVLPHLKLTNHHEFIGLIDILIDDGCAFKLEPKGESLDYYKTRIMITPKGIQLLKVGGYTWKRRWDFIKKAANTLNALILCFVAVVGIWLGWVSFHQETKENETDIAQIYKCEKLDEGKYNVRFASNSNEDYELHVGRDFLIPTLSKDGLSKNRICAKGIPSGNPSALFKYTLSVWSWDHLIMKSGLGTT